MMICWILVRAVALILFGALSMQLTPSVVRAQSGDAFEVLNQQVRQLYKTGKYADAMEFGERSTA